MLESALENRLSDLALALVDQNRSEICIPPLANQAGFWFGGGNLVAHQSDLYLVGRYRNAGDSRTGLRAGERGLELAIWQSRDGGEFRKLVSLPKSSLNVGERSVFSIEGSALRVTNDGRFELFVSTEKDNVGYPASVVGFLKPGTGVWTVDRMTANEVEQFESAAPQTLIECHDPRFIHCKDPNVCELENGQTLLTFCTHPYCWSSSNTAFVLRSAAGANVAAPRYDCFPRGFAWDVAMTRVTSVLRVPSVGPFASLNVKLLFYDGGESLRNLDQHEKSVSRPRGYSCEELGGVAYMIDDDLDNIVRLSKLSPFFVSPHGTGCSRYVSVTATNDRLIATWQQSQPDESQPLVIHSLTTGEVERLLRL